jgi:hypothetical protein
MPNMISGPYRFIESGEGLVHLEFFSSPGWTLCGFEFAQDGSAVAPPGRIRFGRAPYRETASRLVNCPRCVERAAAPTQPKTATGSTSGEAERKRLGEGSKGRLQPSFEPAGHGKGPRRAGDTDARSSALKRKKFA